MSMFEYFTQSKICQSGPGDSYTSQLLSIIHEIKKSLDEVHL